MKTETESIKIILMRHSMNQTYIKKLWIKDLDLIYPYMEKDFPANELKPFSMIQKSFETGFMEGYGFYQQTEDGTEALLAYALFVSIENMMLFDYLAVVPEYRNSGVGSKFLAQLQEKLKGKDCIIGEVENPDYCEDETEKHTMQRRIAFYKRNGVRDTGVSGCVYGAEYRFFELEGFEEHTPEEALTIMERFYRVYWPSDENFHKYVQFHNHKR